MEHLCSKHLYQKWPCNYTAGVCKRNYFFLGQQNPNDCWQTWCSENTDFHDTCNTLFIWIYLRVTITIFHCNPTLEAQSFSTPSTQLSISLLYGSILLPAKKRHPLQRGKVVLAWIKPIKETALTQNLPWTSLHELGIHLSCSISNDKMEKWSRTHLRHLLTWAQALTCEVNIQRL